jgi:hypothetical protein
MRDREEDREAGEWRGEAERMGRLKSKMRKKTCTGRVLALTRDRSCVMAAPNETTTTSLTPNKSLASHVAPCHAHGDSRSPAHRPLPSTGRRHHDRRQLQHEGRQSPAVGNSGVFPGEPHAYRPRKVVRREPNMVHAFTNMPPFYPGTAIWSATWCPTAMRVLHSALIAAGTSRSTCPRLTRSGQEIVLDVRHQPGGRRVSRWPRKLALTVASTWLQADYRLSCTASKETGVKSSFQISDRQWCPVTPNCKRQSRAQKQLLMLLPQPELTPATQIVKP